MKLACFSFLVGWVSLGFGLGLSIPSVSAAGTRPNVVLIMTDNHGAWTLGCYGNEDIRTPQIDQMAREGTLFTQAFSSNPVCSPTRATYLTGLMPSQHGVHCFLRGGRLQTGPEARNTLGEFTSLPEILDEAGYACGLVGKWHLGGNISPQEKLDDYWITMPHGGTSTFYGAKIIEDGKQRNEPEYLTDFWTKHAVRFIDQQAESENPFFLFLSYNGPYALSRLLLREGQNRHAEYYADKPLPSFPRQPAHPWQYHNLDYHNNPVSIRRVATEVSGVDDGVGRVLDTLREKGIEKNTVVIFVADQGWSGGHGGYFGMGDHTRPVTADDEMMKVPMIWRHPGHISSDAKSNVLITNYDFLPTLLGYLGMSDQLPNDPPLPGRDFSTELTAANSTSVEDEAVFYEFERLRCIRTRDWKYVHRHPNGPHELYHLTNDPDEFTNLVTFEEYEDTREMLKQRLDDYFKKYAEPRYDMWNGGGSQTAIYVGIDEERAQTEDILPPALPKDFQPVEISVPDGFTVELVAGPPLVEHPTFATFDDRGRLFVCENAGVNLSANELEEQLPNSIRLLEDVDQDGRFEKSTVFADKMTFPMGAAWHDGALYVASPPNIWRLEDTDDDGVADKREKLVSEFGYTGNAASIHGPVSGPDGRLYWCDGYHGHTFENEDGEVTSQREGSYLFSCRTDGSDVRIHCGGGMDNPVEVDFTPTGEMLGTVNILYTRPRVDALVHWLYGGAYPHRERVLKELQTTGDLLGPVHEFGHVAVSGTMRYRSGILDHRWRDNFFATFFNQGKVVRLELSPNGSTYEVRQREFLASENRDFHPTDIVEDADGSLLVVDTGGWFYRGCPTSQFAKPDVLGGIYRIRRQGMTAWDDPSGNDIDWNSLTPAELVKLLGDRRPVVWEHAINECAKRSAEVTGLLASTIRTRDIRLRYGAVWALTRMHPKTPAIRSAIQTALTDRDPGVRAAACRSLVADPDPSAFKQLSRLVIDDEPTVRRVAATALGRLGDRQAIPVLLKSLANPVDRALEHALTFALIEINDADSMRKALTSSDPNVRKNALIALDQMTSGELTEAEVVTQVESGHPAIERVAARIYARHSDWTEHTATVAGRLLSDPAQLSANQDVVRRLLSRSLNDPQVVQLIGEQLSRPDIPRELQSLLLSVMTTRTSTEAAEAWAPALDSLLASDDHQSVQAAIVAVASMKTNRFDKRLQQIETDSDQPILLRVAAKEARSGKRGHLTDKSFQLLTKALEDNPSQALSIAQKIGTTSLSKPQLLQLTRVFPQVSASVLSELIRPYARTGDAEVVQQFLNGISRAEQGAKLSAVQFSDIIKRYPQDLLPQANKLLDRMRQAEQAKLNRLDSLIALLDDGDAARGRVLFANEKTKCVTCHRVGTMGGKIGPDLTTIGANRSARDLLESIVFPSASIVRDYDSYRIATSDGQVYAGLIVRETDAELVIQQQAGDPVTIARDDIEILSPSDVSIMPKGLEENLSGQQLADLVAYLRSLQSKKVDQND
ncbi:PVC-type heme-binding CxxCH protein [Thalassoroseus pseudoceratinae]|uniref:PVC-type heme-binding CxxCH protein n=1 Tax=Thalassoroseus pseudoceratinae TaxID=2713176 RepID=UPI0014248529|nr:PVC-type heme-binding CxxCH protein [Thalassoroseus pseudoceratinae]